MLGTKRLELSLATAFFRAAVVLCALLVAQLATADQLGIKPPKCKSDKDCASGFCDEGVCRYLSVGEKCDPKRPEQCASGYCHPYPKYAICLDYIPVTTDAKVTSSMKVLQKAPIGFKRVFSTEACINDSSCGKPGVLVCGIEEKLPNLPMTGEACPVDPAYLYLSVEASRKCEKIHSNAIGQACIKHEECSSHACVQSDLLGIGVCVESVASCTGGWVYSNGQTVCESGQFRTEVRRKPAGECCWSTAQCEPGLFCGIDQQRVGKMFKGSLEMSCEPPNQRHDRCWLDAECNSGYCRYDEDGNAFTCSGLAVGEECASAEECESDFCGRDIIRHSASPYAVPHYVPQDPECMPSGLGEGELCDHDAQCAGDLSCRYWHPSTLPPRYMIISDSSIEGGEIAIHLDDGAPFRCRLRIIHAACQRDAQCQSGVCNVSYHDPTQYRSGQWPPDPRPTYNDDVCVPSDLARGEYCGDDRQCRSGQCSFSGTDPVTSYGISRCL